MKLLIVLFLDWHLLYFYDMYDNNIFTLEVMTFTYSDVEHKSNKYS